MTGNLSFFLAQLRSCLLPVACCLLPVACCLPFLYNTDATGHDIRLDERSNDIFILAGEDIQVLIDKNGEVTIL
ncbi:hypothetical protein AFK68_07595 [Hydrocoleum sp. CS-953]|uniref:DUF6888 family protein n=1 Tax=Hydrocoleum sp. CS-953 TaxID=1671698 RepID=UPI000BD2D939|nr:hypothetical protein [Hydrocoleum sp. CS-953]OZH54958.1 hypothetical protein AFK68_07595 [Hydrocoleum sp. CS-953]